MASAEKALQMMTARFEGRTRLSAEDRAALASLPFEQKTYRMHTYLVREGECPRTAKLIIEGLAVRHKVTVEGARQIVSVHMDGDFVDLEGSLLSVADHNVQALTECRVAQVPREALVKVIDNHGTLAHAMWLDTLIDASIYRERVVNVGRRGARQAMCHLLCEIGRRMEIAGIAKSGGYELPMTQEQLADSLGITPVHVNRVL
ncbi:MAG: Crp/Fnr family transcriptional regulator, partial [Sphingomicrobium sp.]